MGYDLVTWAPCIGGGGDNNYNPPGGTKLDNTLDTGNQTGVDAGDASGFSTTPTILQLNASSGINQIIGAYNRRARTYNTAFGTSLAILSYLSQGVVPLAADFINILANINLLRTQEGWTNNLVWPNTTPTSGRVPRGDHLAFLRKALAISGTMMFTNFAASGEKNYHRGDFPSYGTENGFSISAIGSPGFVGKNYDGTSMNRYREMLILNVPEWVSAITTATVILRWLTIIDQGDGLFTPTIYSFSSDVSSPTEANFNAPSTSEGTVSLVVGDQSLVVSNARVVARAGQHYCIEVVSNVELAGGGGSTVGCLGELDYGSGGTKTRVTLTF